MITQMFQGFCMALADSVPGVSGGTVAFIMGFYERFLGALHGLGSREKRGDALRYLRKWGAGWLVGFCASVLFLSRMFETHIYLMSSLFIGLTAASFPSVIREEKKALRGFFRGLPFLLAGLVLVWGMASLENEGGLAGNFDYHSLSAGRYGLLFLSGILAVSAMILPGISGSTLLLITGVYLPTIRAFSALLQGDFAVFPGIAVYVMGLAAGAVLSVRILRDALRNHRRPVIYLVLGLMLGSLEAIAQGPAMLHNPQPALSPETFSFLGFFGGCCILALLEHLKKITAEKENDPPCGK